MSKEKRMKHIGWMTEMRFDHAPRWRPIDGSFSRKKRGLCYAYYERNPGELKEDIRQGYTRIIKVFKEIPK